jgi:hypothetical protein
MRYDKSPSRNLTVEHCAFGRAEGASRDVCTQGLRPGLSHPTELRSPGTPAGSGRVNPRLPLPSLRSGISYAQEFGFETVSKQGSSEGVKSP